MVLAGAALAGTVVRTMAAPAARVEPAFPRLIFDKPLYVAYPPDGSNRLFVVEQDGRVSWVENRPDASKAALALDISKKVRREHMEEGLLGLAFHPRFRQNGYVYLLYSASPRRDVISRFTFNEKRTVIRPGSESLILEIEEPYGNHNGGMIDFGPDGYLYVALGDGGSGGDPHDNAQKKDALLGKILRIDVDHADPGRAYAIPKDNPFAHEPGVRGEIWAWGLRNPWRFSFDKMTGALWAGDVGQNAWEEIDIIKKGLNYGWNRREGRHPYDKKRPAPGPYEEPVAEHGRDEAQCITGGYVYRGQKIKSLYGYYVYGDFVTGGIWALDASRAPHARPELIGHGTLISSFGVDKDGELYFTSFDGRIYTFRNPK